VIDTHRASLATRLLLAATAVACGGAHRTGSVASTPAALPASTPAQQASVGPFLFDPKGTDFTVWLRHLKGEVYRRWVLPTSVRNGERGHLDLELSVARDGSASAFRIVRSSGSPQLDQAAETAVRAGHLLPLPESFPDPTLIIQVSFWYNSSPKAPNAP